MWTKVFELIRVQSMSVASSITLHKAHTNLRFC